MQKPFLRRFTKKLLIFINVCVGVLFLCGAHAARFDPVRWWFFNLLSLTLPYLLAALLLFFFFWLVAKPWLALIPVVFIALAWQPVQHVIPPRISSSFNMQKKAGNLRIMSWNVELFNILSHKKNPEKRQAMFDLINRYNPDIACFQEVVAGDDKEAVNYFPDIFNALKFKDYLYSYQLRFDFDKHHHFGILVLSKFPLVRKQTMVNNPDDYNSTFQFVDVAIQEDTIRVFNIHLQSLKFSRENMEYLSGERTAKSENIAESKNIISKIRTGIIKRASQATFIKDEMNHSPYPLIVCGDFNDVPASFAYETIGKGLQNAFVKKGAGLSHTFAGISPTLRIDNIFAAPAFSIEQYTRVNKVISDHFPIIADVKLKKGELNSF